MLPNICVSYDSLYNPPPEGRCQFTPNFVVARLRFGTARGFPCPPDPPLRVVNL